MRTRPPVLAIPRPERRHLGRLLVAGALTGVGLVAMPVDAAVLHVDVDADGPTADGTTWCTAFGDLSTALAAAVPGDEIRIADGTVRPDPAGLGDPRTATFALVHDVAIVGGYAGCGAADPDLRDVDLHPTVLSGDAGTPGVPGDDVYHVVTTGEGIATMLDGVTITSGNADTAPHDLGGGVFAPGGALDLVRCTLRENRAVRGGAIYAEGAAITLERCVIRDNRATGEGGAMFLATGSCRAESCLVTDNHAGSDGGALFCDLVEIDLVNVTLHGNHSDARGGAVYNYVGVGMIITSGIVWANTDMTGATEDAQLWNQPSNFLLVNHSCVMGWSGTIGGTMTFGDDPAFVNPDAGDLHLQGTSPCLDRGDASLITLAVDLDGRPRWVGSGVDLGCYEYSSVLEAPPAEVARPVLSVRPHPVRGIARVEVPAEVRRVVVVDAGGRRVRSLVPGPDGVAIWDGTDVAGARPPAGVYLLAAHGRDGVVATRRIVVLP